MTVGRTGNADDAVVGVLCNPSDAAWIFDYMRSRGDHPETFSWFRRAATMVKDGLPGDIIRVALAASCAVDVQELATFANSAGDRDYTIRPFVAVAMVIGGRLDVDQIVSKPIRFSECKDYFALSIASLSTNIIPDSPEQAYDIIRLKENISEHLSHSARFKLKSTISFGLSKFIHRIRRNLYKDEFRGFTDMWTFAIGHLVVLTFLIQGQARGIFDYRASKIWKGRVANSLLWKKIFTLSDTVEVVPKGSVFADNHLSTHLEWVDGQFIDCFETCGVVADRAGDLRGGILDKPTLEDPPLRRFLETVGFGPADRIVTLHCREPGFRRMGSASLRDVDIAAYPPALARLVERGYRVVRMGDSSMTPLPLMEGVFDYALSPLKSDELDVLLPGVARFHIGSSSGLSLVPLLFGVPCLFLNWHPIELLPWGRRNWTVVKPIASQDNGRLVVDWRTYATLGRIRDPKLLASFGYGIRDLTAVEVEAAVIDFAAVLEADLPEPPKVGLNRGRVLVYNDRGVLQDLTEPRVS